MSARTQIHHHPAMGRHAGKRGEVADPSDRLQSRLGVAVEGSLLELALTHRSFAFESGGVPDNERLEFLGDAVLGLVVTDELYRRHPDRSEGDLARMRASVVNARSLAEVAEQLGLGECLRLGRGEESSGGRQKPSILADALEAVIGATYLSSDIDTVRTVLLIWFAQLLDRAGGLGAGLDWKTSLQELASERGWTAPTYVVTSTGPDHAKVFDAQVLVAGEVAGEGSGTAKKHAEQEAARRAYESLATPGSGAGD